MNIYDALDFALNTALGTGIDEVEVAASIERLTSAMIERDEVRLGKSQQFSPLGVRVLKGKSQGFATTNALSKASIKRCVEEATAISRVSPPDNYNNIPAGTEVGSLDGIYDKSTRNVTPSDVVEKADSMLDFTKSYDTRIKVDGGIFTVGEEEKLIRNSNGRMAKQLTTLSSWKLIGMAVDGSEVTSFDVAHGSHHFFSEANPEESVRELCNMVISSLRARKSESFKGTLIMSPEAFGDIFISPIMSAACALSVQKERSPLAGKIGQQLATEMLTITDDGTRQEGSNACGFDREGTPCRRNRLLDKGFLTTYLQSCYTAARDKTESTGNASGSASSPPGNGPSNIVVEEGNQSLDSLYKETSRGIIVNRFSGNVDSATGDFSGVVKGGSVIQNGEITNPVKETLIAGNVYQLLNSISGISKVRKVMDNYILPYVKVENVSVI